MELKRHENFLNENSEYKEDIGFALSTMVEGDDMDFEPLDTDNEIFTEIGFKADEEDPMDWADNLSDEEATRVRTILNDKGYL